jgi:hypothetical protein
MLKIKPSTARSECWCVCRHSLLRSGLAEITRLAVAKGANPLTMGGLAGMGDLVLTCTGERRNSCKNNGAVLHISSPPLGCGADGLDAMPVVTGWW